MELRPRALPAVQNPAMRNPVMQFRYPALFVLTLVIICLIGLLGLHVFVAMISSHVIPRMRIAVEFGFVCGLWLIVFIAPE